MGTHAELERRKAEIERQQAALARVAAPGQVARRPGAAPPTDDVARDLDSVARRVHDSVGSSSPDVIRRAPRKNRRRRKRAAAKKGSASGGATTTVIEPEAPAEPTPEELVAQELERRETEQLTEGSAWQSRIQAMSRPVVGPHEWSTRSAGGGDDASTDDGPRKIPARMERRRERQLGAFLANHPAKVVERATAEQREIDDAPYRSTEAQDQLRTKESETKDKVDAAKQVAKDVGLPVDRLTTMFRKCASVRAAESWYELDNLLDEVVTESQKMISYANGLATSDSRIMALPGHLKNKKYDLRMAFSAFRVAASKSSRDDNDVSAKLQKLLDDLQTHEDAELARDSARAAAVAHRTAMRNAGRWPGNDDPRAEIATATRADVGRSDDERLAVVEALDALKGSTRPSWARKWAVAHGNGEGNLPGIPGGGGYQEYYVRPAGSPVGDRRRTEAGTRRLVVHTATGRVYYSHNHYGSPGGRTLPAFVLVTDA